MHPAVFNNTLYENPDTANTKEGLNSKTVIVELIESVLDLCVHVCVAPCLGHREAQLPQLSTFALPLKSDGPLLHGCPWIPHSPAHCCPGPGAPQMIYYKEREKKGEHSALTSPHLPHDPSSLHLSLLPQLCMPVLLLSDTISQKNTNPLQSSVLLYHFIWNPFY